MITFKDKINSIKKNKIYHYKNELGNECRFKPIIEVEYYNKSNYLLVEIIDGNKIAWNKEYFKTKNGLSKIIIDKYMNEISKYDI